MEPLTSLAPYVLPATQVALAVLALVYRLGDFPVVYHPGLIAGTLAGSAALGVLAGAYPAWQAANVAVLAVLRDE